MNTSSIIYFISSSFKSMYKNALMTIASVFILIACMLIMGTVFLLSQNVMCFIDDLGKQNEIIAYIDDEYSDDSSSRKELCEKVEAITGVSSVEYITKEQALSEYRNSLGEDGDYLEVYQGEENPLRNELRIKIDDIDMFSTISFEVSEFEEIHSIRDLRELVEKLIDIRNTFQLYGIVFFAFLAIVSLFIISNTIKLTMYSRRNEINIMKYVGATNSFIRFPFVLEGIIIGTVSTIIALASEWCVYNYGLYPFLQSIPFLAKSSVTFNDAFVYLLAIFAIIGIVVGVFGSVISIRKYLKV